MPTHPFSSPISLIYFLIFGLFTLEFLAYRGFLTNYLAPPWLLLFLALLLLLSARLFRQTFPKKLIKFNRLSLVIISLLAIILFAVETYSFPNYIYSTLHVNHFALIPFILFTFFSHLIFSPLKHLKTFWPTYILLGFLLVCWYLFNFHFELFLKLSFNRDGTYDDNFMEWLQVIVLLIGAGTSSLLSFRHRHHKKLAFVYFLGTFVFLFLVGEEISWGERLIDLPFSVSSQNLQQETNLHNLEGFNQITGFLYIFAFIYALGSWITHLYAQKNNLTKSKHQPWWCLFTFKGQEVVYFLPTFIFNPYADRTLISGQPSILNLYDKWGLLPDFYQSLHFLAQWRETFEVVFYLGLTLHLIQLLKPKPSKS